MATKTKARGEKAISKALAKLPSVKRVERVFYDDIDITIPDYLYAGPLLPLEQRPVPPSIHTQRVWIMPDKNRPAPPPMPVFVDDRTQHVIVNGPDKAKLGEYENMDEFDANHDKGAYPVRRTMSYEGVTFVMCSAKPWAGKPREKIVGPKPTERSKVHVIGDLLKRPEGCTTTDVLAATGWPSVSMPAQAKLAGLVLRKEKVGKITTYYGSKK